MKIGVAGQGAFGIKHLEAIQNIPGIEVVTLAGGSPDSTAGGRQEVRHPALVHAISRESLTQPGVEAVILATPTQMHAKQAMQCMRAGKHVQVEIPMADNRGRRRDDRRGAEGNRPGRHGGPHAPLQPEPPVGAQDASRPAS